MFFFKIFIFLIFTGCSSINKNNWTNPKNHKILTNLNAGDILIKKKTFSILGIFGHSAIMETKSMVIDYPKIGKSGYKVYIKYWLEENRDILILRYKYMDDKFKNTLIKNIKKYSYKKYRLKFNRKNSNTFYCSHYIWFIFYITALEHNFKLDIDKNKGIFIFPYDLINFQKFEIINFN